MFIGWYCSKDYVLIQSLRENAKIRPNKGKTKNPKKGTWKQNREEFYATFCTKDWDDYKRDSFSVMVTAVDPHLKEKKYKDSFVLVRGFKSLKEIPKEKTRLLWQKAKESGQTGEPWHKIKTTKMENRVIFLLVYLFISY